METSLPVLVTRLSDRTALTRLVRAALGHEIAQVALAAMPGPGEHTLDLQLEGAPSVTVIAEVSGPGESGVFALRLRPRSRAQATELYALLAEKSSPGGPDPADTAPPGSDAPDTENGPPRTVGFEERRGSVVPAPFVARETARLDTVRGVAPTSDLRQTTPSAKWTAREKTEAPAFLAGLADDPRRTTRSARWVPAPSSLPPATVNDPLSEQPPTPTLAMDFAAALAFAELPLEDRTIALATQAGSDFFDDALANFAMPLPAADDQDALDPVAPSTDDERFRPATLSAPRLRADDDDFATLIRFPSSANFERERPRPPRPSGTSTDADFEVLTPTASDAPPRKPSSAGRRRRTTRTGKDDPRSSKRHPPPARLSLTADAPPDVLHALAIARGNLAEPEHDPLVGRKIGEGKYAIESAIGMGAAGAVYKAIHRELRRPVAVKVLHAHYQQDPHFMKSFRGEALAASQLDHPNVMRVLDFGQEPDGLVYIVMEFLSGRTLQSLLDEEQRLATERAVEIMVQVCAALSVAHDNGIIHRDIKPDNIMLVPSRNDEGGAFELVKVCDFGIAALQNPTREDADIVELPDNVIAGTPEYMSPEQVRGSKIDERSDVYAAGICLYELVTGQPPFNGETVAAILVKQLDEEPLPPTAIAPGLDPAVEEIILRAIAKEPANRQQSARELRIELKEVIDPSVGAATYDDSSIVESVPGLDDPASGFPGFFIALASALRRFGRFERGHPEAGQAMLELLRAAKPALRGRRELTFARRDSAKTIGLSVMSGHGETADLRRLLGSQLFGSFGYPFIEAIAKKGIAAITLREGIPDNELQYVIETMLGPYDNDALRKDLLAKPLRNIAVLFAVDIVGRTRRLTWKVGLCIARLAHDLRALANVRGISLKKMRELREDLVGGVAELLTKGEEVRQFVLNADLIDEAVSNLRGFSSFETTPLLLERAHADSCADAVLLLVGDYDKDGANHETITRYLRMPVSRFIHARSLKADLALTELYRRSIVTDVDMPADLLEQIRARSLAEALIHEPAQFLRTLDFIHDGEAYGLELRTLESAMEVLARRAEARALLAVISVLARHAKGTGRAGSRESHALRTMKSIIDKERLVPTARALLSGPANQSEAARQLLILAGSAGAHALFTARAAVSDRNARALFVATFRETGPAGWALLASVLPRVEVNNDADLALVDDLLRAMPDRRDPALGEVAAKFLTHPRLRPAALAALGSLWGERARKPLMDALAFAEEPARIVAVAELRRMRGVDEQVVNVIERLLTLKGSASDELRAALAAALADVGAAQKMRAKTLLAKGVEGKRGFVAMLRGDGGSDESVTVTEAMAKALLVLDRAEGVRALKARIAKADPHLRARLIALLPLT